uniref:Bestrophin homolog n=1 Tax=Panagrolaimus davidi TaxID=227884 RepID=A0A914QRP6_9BILA
MILYRYGLNPKEQRTFELLAEYCDKRLDYFPLMLMLGFFVATVVDRWKTMFANIGFIDNVAIYVSTTIVGVGDDLKVIRRNIIRYCCLTQVLVLRDISMRVRKRFPNLEAVVEAGFLMPHELKHIEDVQNLHPKYWLPIQWVFILLSDLRRKNRMEPEGYVNMLMGEVINYRNCLQNLCNYDYVPIPLAYPQTIALAIRFYFLIALISRQYLIHRTSNEPVTIDFYVPFMTIFQFIFYIGWLKVAEALLNPLGEDIGMAIVDDAYGRIPEQLPDQFKTNPLYSEQSASTPIHPLIGSAAQAGVKSEEDEIKMVPHADYEKKKSTAVQPPPQTSTIQLKKRKAFTQPELSKKWSISLFSRNKRIPTLEEVQVISSGRIEYGPKREKKDETTNIGKDNAPVTFTVPGSQETERQTERNKQMYLSSIKEDKEDPTNDPPPV